MSYDLNSEGSKKTYPNVSLEDASVPPPHLISRCDHDKDAHVKQSRYPTMVTHAYYCCPYKIVSINFSSLIRLI
jgi:hypothetical protein